MRIFAYGSNLSSERLRARVPSARFIGRARLDGYVLRFHKRGRDGSGKANAFRTAAVGDCVWGAVFECPEAEKRGLDRAERGYDEATVTVALDDGRQEDALAYVAAPATIDDALRPYTWYHDYVVTGAVEQELPPAYIEELRACRTVRDPDAPREARNTPVRA